MQDEIDEPAKNDIVDQNDRELLEQFGYKQEFKRSFSLISMVGFAFAILSCWTALSGTLVQAMTNGGPVALVWGWIGVSVFTFTVVISMAEISSAYPVDGGQYSWVLLLSRNTSWGKGLSYTTGFIQLAGLLCMGSTALFQFGLFVAGLTVLNSDGEVWVPQNWQVVLLCWSLCVLCALVNVFANRLLPIISNFALWWSIGGFIICTVVLLAVTPHTRDAKFVFTTVIDDSGWNNTGMAVLLGVLNSAYGFVTYDSPCHQSESMKHANRDIPRVMVLSVIIGFITGFGFILALLFSIQDLDSVSATVTGVPLLEIFFQSTNSKAGSTCLLVIVMVCQVFAANGLLVEGYRSIFAFARDGGFPSKLNVYLRHVSPKYNVPIWSLLVCAFFQCGFVAIYFGSDAAFFTVISIATVGLYVSYLMPILVVMFRRPYKIPGYYNLGKWALWMNIPASIYLIFCSVLFFFPTELPVNGNTMNYTIAAFVITGIIGAICWFGGGRSTYGVLTENLVIDGVVVNSHGSSSSSEELSEAIKIGVDEKKY